MDQSCVSSLWDWSLATIFFKLLAYSLVMNQAGIAPRYREKDSPRCREKDCQVVDGVHPITASARICTTLSVSMPGYCNVAPARLLTK
jgi:hypothetical protein